MCYQDTEKQGLRTVVNELTRRRSSLYGVRRWLPPSLSSFPGFCIFEFCGSFDSVRTSSHQQLGICSLVEVHTPLIIDKFVQLKFNRSNSSHHILNHLREIDRLRL